MNVERLDNRAGVTVNLGPDECQLFVRLAQDAERASQDRNGAPDLFKETAPNYFSVSLKIGKQIGALLNGQTIIP
jgi:hypothetical protein